MRRGLWISMLLLAIALPCRAQTYAFGGRGEDALYEAVPTGDGFLAVGKTGSTDGDLATRTRTGETGWAIRVDGSGRLLWDFCSGKSGMLVMSAPRAYPDGRYSLVLTDETRQRGEWIVLSSRGRQESRTAIPALTALCPAQKAGRLIAMIPAHGRTGPYLALILLHEDSGALCCSSLFPDGSVRTCGEFYGDAAGCALPLEEGGVLHVGAELGALALTRLRPGTPPETAVLPLEAEETGLSRVSDALVCGDGSIVLCGQTVTADQKSAGLLLRVSAEGETLFAKVFSEDESLPLLTETDTGYAVLSGTTGSVLFFDEDGAPQGQAKAQSELLALLPAGGGVLALSHDAERGRRQAVFTHMAPGQGALEAPVTDMTTAEPTASPAHEAGRIGLADGYLLCSGGYGGVTVSRMDGAGNMLWQTRIPIHTAADRLVWERAELTAQGDVLLSGYYETDMKDGVLREGAGARLDVSGVLKEIRLTE